MASLVLDEDFRCKLNVKLALFMLLERDAIYRSLDVVFLVLDASVNARNCRLRAPSMGYLFRRATGRLVATRLLLTLLNHLLLTLPTGAVFSRHILFIRLLLRNLPCFHKQAKLRGHLPFLGSGRTVKHRYISIIILHRLLLLLLGLRPCARH